jgi:hypothetical protein
MTAVKIFIFYSDKDNYWINMCVYIHTYMLTFRTLIIDAGVTSS